MVEVFSVGCSDSILRSPCIPKAIDDAPDWAAPFATAGRVVRQARRGQGTCGSELTIDS